MDELRLSLERDVDLFNRYGDARLSCRNGYFGFKTVVPNRGESKLRCFFRMLVCTYVFLPCGWHEDECSRKAYRWADCLGKKIIYGEDRRCR